MLMKIDFSGEANVIAYRLSDFVLYFATCVAVNG